MQGEVNKPRGTAKGAHAEDLLETPFATGLMGKSGLIAESPAFDHMVGGLSELDETDRRIVFIELTDPQKGPKWADALVQAVPQFSGPSGAECGINREVAARRGAEVPGKLQQFGAKLNHLQPGQMRAFFRHMADKPTDYDPSTIANTISQARELPGAWLEAGSQAMSPDGTVMDYGREG